ncbi:MULTISPECIES: hypothetical protein [unclassified Mesorhizobium]|uniref:DUF4760 domain-containing protein n=1 Tax=unclassified Mesorhizobium TaxID=325217 RepID=UPI000FC9DE2C|nr:MULTISPECIES: hypothetical protein [unclassified Mesorhizobium]RUW77450.1 hypothetical protein EOA31_04640 [Mesorhizobium sp. M4B.F.Ca.ET.049.02.1.2]RVD21092.1 hypothetical protein EN738_19940 [Mesorhizobium sp. M4B.F.Ca.ET.017.02.2.1]TGV25457.1 hypothetical protein EN786_13745 [Mesorhizobium sp. M4B.F.Ca.ET.143.01.1.1]
MVDSEESGATGISRLSLVLIFGGVIVLWIATPFAMRCIYPNLSDRGLSGDLYGSVNALFSGLAFAGVIVAILLQREELALQREEQKQMREEVQRSTEAQNEAQRALNKTIYAQTFKVALDIIESPEAVSARGVVARAKEEFRKPVGEWDAGQRAAAETVARTFESVGTLIKHGLLPAAYIVETWSVPIERNWVVLEPYVLDLRASRSDPYAAVDFEILADEASKFLQKSARTPLASAASPTSG